MIHACMHALVTTRKSPLYLLDPTHRPTLISLTHPRGDLRNSLFQRRFEMPSINRFNEEGLAHSVVDSLVTYIDYFCAREAFRSFGEVAEVDVCGYGHFTGLYLENLLSGGQVWRSDVEDCVEAAGAEERRVLGQLSNLEVN